LEDEITVVLQHPTKDLVDDQYFAIWDHLIGKKRMVHVPKTIRYTTVTGATRTVLLVEVVQEEE
jgi:hypothetical protein